MAVYSLREAELALRLLDKLQIITETLEMARVSFSYLTFHIDVVFEACLGGLASFSPCCLELAGAELCRFWIRFV
jgi:hypothetical protein